MQFFFPKNKYNKTEFVRSTVCREEAKLHLYPHYAFTRDSLTKIQINKRKTNSLLMHSVHIIWKKPKIKNNSKWWLRTLVYRTSSTKENTFVEEWTKDSNCRLPWMANCGKVNIWDGTNGVSFVFCLLQMSW